MTSAEEQESRDTAVETARLEVAIDLLAELRDEYRALIARATVHEVDDLRRSLWQIEAGVDPNDAVDQRIFKIISDPRIAGLGLKPGIAVFERRLRRLRPVESSRQSERLGTGSAT